MIREFPHPCVDVLRGEDDEPQDDDEGKIEGKVDFEIFGNGGGEKRESREEDIEQSSLRIDLHGFWELCHHWIETWRKPCVAGLVHDAGRKKLRGRDGEVRKKVNIRGHEQRIDGKKTLAANGRGGRTRKLVPIECLGRLEYLYELCTRQAAYK